MHLVATVLSFNKPDYLTFEEWPQFLQRQNKLQVAAHAVRRPVTGKYSRGESGCDCGNFQYCDGHTWNGNFNETKINFKGSSINIKILSYVKFFL